MSVITISRQTASLADEISRLVCERLGYQYFDKNLMMELAPEVGLAAEAVVDVRADAQQPKSLWERLFGNYQAPLGDPAGWTYLARQDAYKEMEVDQVLKLIHAAYGKGNVVIAGRGGQVALANKPDVLHVRIVAPAAVRAKRWQERIPGLSEEDAMERVRIRDQAHIDFVQRFYNIDLADPALYDLVINTAKITPSAAADLIIKALEGLPVAARA